LNVASHQVMRVVAPIRSPGTARAQPRIFMKLQPKQARFVAEYLIDLNCTKAALRAGYTPDRRASSERKT
jgi:hypothetical protein